MKNLAIACIAKVGILENGKSLLDVLDEKKIPLGTTTTIENYKTITSLAKDLQNKALSRFMDKIINSVIRPSEDWAKKEIHDNHFAEPESQQQDTSDEGDDHPNTPKM